MNRFCRIAASIALGFLLALQQATTPMIAWGEVPKVSDQSRDKLQGLADALNSQDPITKTILGQLGFPPKEAPPTWRHWDEWTNIRMLETAYVSAEVARPGGGQAFLNKFTRLLAANHTDVIRHEPILADLFHEPVGVPITETVERFAFGVPTPEQIKAPLPPKAKAHIKIVSRYTESVHRPWLFAQCCALTEDETYEVLREGPTDEAAFEAAIKLKSPPPTDQEKLSRLIEAVHMDNPAIAFEPELSAQFHPVTPRVRDADLRDVNDQVAKAVHGMLLPIIDSASPPVPPTSGSPPPSVGPGPQPFGPPRAGPAPSPKSGPSPRTMSEDAYRVFERSRYPTSGRAGWTYSRMVTWVFGFGGVIFGNEVSAQRSLPPVTSISWVNGANAAAATSANVVEKWGRLVFKLGDGRVVLSHTVRADAVIAAKAAAIDHQSGSANTALGLVGYVGPFAIASFDSDNGPGKVSQGLSFVVNPDVIATRLGHSMMVLDTLPMIADQFVKQVADSGVPKEKVDLLDNILNGKYGTLGQYKFTDVKLQVILDGDGLISVQRSEADSPAADPRTRHKAYITLISFDGQKPRSENAIPVYSLVPTLVQVAEPFARANEFAEVYALLRWAKASGAEWLGQEPPTPNVQAATALLVGADGSYTFGSSAAAFSQDMANRVYSQAKSLALKSGNSSFLATTNELQKKFSDLIQSRAALQTAGSAVEVLGAAFSADPGLAKRYPEIARQAVTANPFRQGTLTSTLKQIQAGASIDENIDNLDRLAPGLKARKVLSDHVEQQDSELSQLLGDPIELFNEFTGQKFAKTIVDLQDQLGKSPDDDNGDDSVKEKILGIMERELPGFERWYTMERSLLRVLEL